MTAILHSLADRLRGGARQVEVVDEPSGADAPAPLGDTDERLVALFRNRAELKKAFTALQEECEELRERLARMEEDPAMHNGRLAALEQRLSERETAYPALVYYQLRGLWRFCHNMLLEFSEQLQEQHHEREYAAHLEAWQTQQGSVLARLDERIGLVEGETARCQAALAEQQAALQELRGFWNHFRRRRLREQLEAQALRVQEARARLTDLRRERESEAEAQAPQFPGLSAEARRNINLAVLAFAQYLYLEFSPNSLSQLSLAAMTRNLTDVSYGTRRDCESLMELIETATVRMAEKRGYGDELKIRAKHLRRRVSFASAEATVPDVASMENFPLEFHDGHAGVQVDVNVLEENYWDLGELLLD